MNSLETLPEDVQKIIFSYAFKCKKEQNFYINKELCNLVSEQVNNCGEIICLGKPICHFFEFRNPKFQIFFETN